MVLAITNATTMIMMMVAILAMRAPYYGQHDGQYYGHVGR
jgi:hypothetical protein